MTDVRTLASIAGGSSESAGRALRHSVPDPCGVLDEIARVAEHALRTSPVAGQDGALRGIRQTARRAARLLSAAEAKPPRSRTRLYLRAQTADRIDGPDFTVWKIRHVR